MSYKCMTCRGIVPSNIPRLIHVVKRENGQIARELAVCEACKEVLQKGTTVKSLLPGLKSSAESVDAKPIVKASLGSGNAQKKIVSTGD